MGNIVLVVDDRPDARYSMGHLLATAGFDVLKTATGRDALRLARLQVDAIVLDLILPDMDGYDVLRELKDDPTTHNIPVVLKTAIYRGEGHRQVALDAGAAEFFAEPFDTQALVNTVRRVLGPDRRRRRRRGVRTRNRLGLVRPQVWRPFYRQSRYKVAEKALDVVQHATLHLWVERLQRQSGDCWTVNEIRRTRRLLVALLAGPNGGTLRIVWRPNASRWSMAQAQW